MVFTIQCIYLIFKEIKKKDFNCYSLRKIFGRQVYNMNSNNMVFILVKPIELFNYHFTTPAFTRNYHSTIRCKSDLKNVQNYIF
jgi:hypothetical protein